MILNYEITGEPVDTGWYMPPELEEQLPELRFMVNSNPKEAIPILEELKKKYPGVPQVYNLLGNAYFALGDKTKADASAKENYLKNPDYLFAKINYAELFIRSQQYEKIPLVFDNKFDLKLLYPHRDVFHLSEVTSFLGVIGIYYISIGEFEAAKGCYDVMKEIYPDHPSTKRLLKYLTE